MNQKYKQRVTDQVLDFKLHSRGAVVIDGPKWCGKTTSAKRFAKSMVEFGDGEQHDQNVTFAKINPSALLQGPTPRLFDEWQEVPSLWDAIRHEVDIRNEVGQFILTGSSVKTPKNESENHRVHTGIGRFSYLLMRPMSLYESGESNGKVSLADLFEKKNIAAESNLILEELAFVTCRGGWPFATFLEDKYALAQAKDYYTAVVHDDVSRVDGVRRDVSVIEKLMRSYAREQGQAPSLSSIASDIGNVTPETVSSYLNALRRIFVIEDTPAWNPNLRSKTAIRTTETRYFVDPSIATAALGLSPQGLIDDLNYFGFVFETLVMRDLRTYLTPLDGSVYHYRDRNGLECDMVAVLPDGKYGLIQVKLGQIDEIVDEAANKMKVLVEKIDVDKMKEPSFMAVITGNGKVAYKREDNVYVIPIGCLKP